MVWLPVSTSTASWTTIPSIYSTSIIEAGSPIGLLLVLTYPTDETVYNELSPSSWSSISTLATTWTATT